MTHYGINPSFLYSSPLPVLASLIRRGRRFEVFDEMGVPRAESPLGPDRLPIADGRLHGVRVWQGPPLGNEIGDVRDVVFSERPSFSSAFKRNAWSGRERVLLRDQEASMPWHRPSLEALAALHPRVLRTLDWQMTNKRPDWSRLRVRRDGLLQGTDRGMAVELQVQAANLLQCHLWWPAPPRFELSVEEYERRLEEYLLAIRDTADRPPVLEYGNELWNAGFAVHGWLRDGAGAGFTPQGFTWHTAAAHEIALLKRVADRVFGPPGPLGARPYYLFVGGQLAVPSHLDRILSALADHGITPDLAGPALYVTPLKAQKEEWEATGAVPTQDELRASCMTRLEEIAYGYRSSDTHAGLLLQNQDVVDRYNVDYFACYEAGQSLLAGAHPWRRAAIAAQREEWMGDLYRGIRRAAEAAGVDLLCWYSAATDQSPDDPRVDVFGLLYGDTSVPMLPKALAAKGD